MFRRIVAVLLAAILVFFALPTQKQALAANTIFEIDIAGDNEQIGEDNYGDAVYLITVPAGTSQISFVCSSDNEITAIHDFYYTREIAEQPIALAEEYTVTLAGLNANCGGYGFEDIYSELPEDIYYGFSIDDREGTYPYYLVKIESGGSNPVATVDKTELQTIFEDLTTNYYKTEDRFNGKKTSTIGFWQEIADDVETARTILYSETATKTQVDNAVNKPVPKNSKNEKD